MLNLNYNFFFNYFINKKKTKEEAYTTYNYYNKLMNLYYF